LLAAHAGRPTPLTPAWRLSAELGINLLLKREDLAHTGSHKINNVLGQALLARRMGRTRLIAETGAGQHGVATATAAALLGLGATVVHGRTRRRAAGAQRGPDAGPGRRGGFRPDGQPHPQGRHQRGDAALGRRDRGLVLLRGLGRGSAPYPWMCGSSSGSSATRRAGSARRSWAAGGPTTWWRAWAAAPTPRAFAGFVDTSARLVGVVAVGGAGASLGRVGVLHGAPSLFLQDGGGQISEAHSVAAGLDYPGVGPEHAHLRDLGRARYETVTDAEAVDAAVRLARAVDVVVPPDLDAFSTASPGRRRCWRRHRAGPQHLPWPTRR
jgi:tryptophan synthase beta chain